MDLIRKPINIATSKPAQRTYLNTFLFLSASTLLFGLACIAYLLFYWNYVPSAGVEKIVHLQFGDGSNPYGMVNLDQLIRGQEYDIFLLLDLPRSPRNLENGNFMLQLRLLSSSWKTTSTVVSLLNDLRAVDIMAPLLDSIVYSTRRPAILTYHDPLASLSQRLLRLPLYAFHLRRESELLRIPLAEAQSFTSEPTLAFVELQNLHPRGIEVYSTVLAFAARFRPFSLRWLMYNHRIISFCLFTTAFWMAEMISAILGWLILSLVFGSSSQGGKKVGGDNRYGAGTVKKENEEEEEEISDTPRTFPTYGRQPPLKYEPQIKQEPVDESSAIVEDAAIQPLVAAEADDELEDVGGEFDDHERRSDSGIGTSYSESAGRAGGGLYRRRSSKGKGPSSR